MFDDTGATAQVRGESLGGGKMRISRINGVGVDISGMYSTLFVAHYDVPGVLAALTNLLAYAHVNIAFCRTYRTEVGGQAYSVFETDARPTTPSSPCSANSTMSITRPLSSSPVLPRRSPPVSRQRRSSTTASSCSMRAPSSADIGAVMAVREARLTGEAHAVAAMRRVLDVMREETTTPIVNPQRSLGGLIGGEAKLVDATGRNDLSTSLMGTVQTDAVARAMAVLERSATMGVIVAAPTAGSAGVVPGCVLALADHLQLDDEQVMDALCWRSPITFSSTTSRSWTRSTAQPPSASTSPRAPASPVPSASTSPRAPASPVPRAAARLRYLRRRCRGRLPG